SADSWWSRDSDIRHSFLHCSNLLKPLDVPFPAVEARMQVGANEIDGERWADDLGAEAEHVHVVVLDTLVGGVNVVADRSSDARHLADGDRGADAGAADENAALCV